MLNFIRKRKIKKIKERNATNGIFGATNPGEFLLSKRKTKKFYISIDTIQKTALKNSKLCLYDEIQNWLYFGDCNPALVVSTSPVVIAAYSYDIDCVVFLLYTQYYARNYKLEAGMRMLSINTYGQWKIQQSDIVRGERASGPWNAYRPLIADFLSDDLEAIKAKKESINDKHWERCRELAEEYPKVFPDTYRIGDPYYALNPSVLRGEKVSPFINIG